MIKGYDITIDDIRDYTYYLLTGATVTEDNIEMQKAYKEYMMDIDNEPITISEYLNIAKKEMVEFVDNNSFKEVVSETMVLLERQIKYNLLAEEEFIQLADLVIEWKKSK